VLATRPDVALVAASQPASTLESMQFRQLEYFGAAAEELNFTHAAHRLNVPMLLDLGAEFQDHRQRCDTRATSLGSLGAEPNVAKVDSKGLVVRRSSCSSVQ
jgi:hypothetical protein